MRHRRNLAGRPRYSFLVVTIIRGNGSTFGDGKNNDQIAKLTAALTLAQRGCVLLYYGEEIGMETMPAGELRLVATGPRRPRTDDRDGERTPMQWDAGVNAGLSNASPWLPVESAYKRYNVQTEKEEPGSLYSWYANLIKLRHENSALRDGSYVPLESGNRDVFTFGRITKANELVLSCEYKRARTTGQH